MKCLLVISLTQLGSTIEPNTFLCAHWKRMNWNVIETSKESVFFSFSTIPNCFLVDYLKYHRRLCEKAVKSHTTNAALFHYKIPWLIVVRSRWLCLRSEQCHFHNHWRFNLNVIFMLLSTSSTDYSPIN